MYMRYLNNMPQQLVDHMSLNSQNIGTIASWVIAMIFGYLLYTRAIKIIKTDQIDPYPLWLHCWMISIDAIGTVDFWMMAVKYHYFWLFVVMGVGLPIWICLEAYCIHFAVTHHRQSEFAGLTKGEISLKQAWLYAIAMILTGFTINMWALSMLGGLNNVAIFIIYPFTNFVFAYWTWRNWRIREVQGSSKGNSLALQIVIFVQLLLMWVPVLSWWENVTPFYNEPWYYLCGACASCIAGYNLYSYVKTLKEN